MQYQTSLSLIGTGEPWQNNSQALLTNKTLVKQLISLHLKTTLNLLDLRLMRQGGGLDISMGKSCMAKAHRQHIKSGAGKQQKLQGISKILLNHSIRIQ